MLRAGFGGIERGRAPPQNGLDKGAFMTAYATDSYDVLGNLVRFLARSPETGGAYSLAEGSFRPGNGAPPNRHPGDDESFYVLEGTFAFVVDGSTRTVTAGDFVRVPNGAVHAFKNVGDDVGRLLIVNTPGRVHDAFFSEVGTPLPPGTREMPPPGGPPDIPRVIEIGRKTGIEFLLDGDH